MADKAKECEAISSQDRAKDGDTERHQNGNGNGNDTTSKPSNMHTKTKPPSPPARTSDPLITPPNPSDRFPISIQRSKFSLAQKYDDKNVGLGEVVTGGEVKFHHGAVEAHEMKVRAQQRSCILMRLWTTLMAAVMVFIVYLISLETILSCALCVGLTIYWHEVNVSDDTGTWDGSNMNWIILGFAVVTPLTVTITLAFQRRERALYEISRIRSLSFQIYLAHAIWDWNSGKGRNNAMNNEKWLKHTDAVLEQLVGIGDELSRFLTLPTSSRSYHRMIKSGRRKAAEIVEVAYRLLDSFYTQRVVKLTKLTETLKGNGLAATEASRLRQYERFIGEAIENLRMIKMYRTPQALRSFGRIFTLILPAFYAPAFAQLAIDLHSITMGILFAILTPLVLTALFETMQIIEDPFVAWVSLDGIDVNEEMQILQFHQLISARNSLFPDAQPFELRSKAAIISLPMSLNSTEMRKSGHSRLGLDFDGSNLPTMDGSHRVSHFAVDAMEDSPPLSASAMTHHRVKSGHNDF